MDMRIVKRFIILAMIPLLICICVFSCGKKPVKPTIIVETNGNKIVIKPVLNKSKEKKLKLTLVRELKGHAQYLFYVDFFKDNKLLASGSADQSVRLWDFHSGIEKKRINEVYDEVWGIPLRFSGNGKYLVIGSYETLKILDATTLKELKSVFAHKRGIQSLNISPDNKTVATAGVDGNIVIWSIPDLELIKKIKGHSSEIWSICISPDGQYMVSGGEDALAKIWKYPSLDLDNQIAFHKFPIEYVRYSDDGKLLLLGSADSKISVWKNGKYSSPYRVLSGHLGSVLVAIFSRDSKYIFSGGDDDEIYAFNIDKDEIVVKVREHWADVMTLAISPDGKYLASGSRDRSIKIWEINYE